MLGKLPLTKLFPQLLVFRDRVIPHSSRRLQTHNLPASTIQERTTIPGLFPIFLMTYFRPWEPFLVTQQFFEHLQVGEAQAKNKSTSPVPTVSHQSWSLL